MCVCVCVCVLETRKRKLLVLEPASEVSELRTHGFADDGRNLRLLSLAI